MFWRWLLSGRLSFTHVPEVLVMDSTAKRDKTVLTLLCEVRMRISLRETKVPPSRGTRISEPINQESQRAWGFKPRCDFCNGPENHTFITAQYPRYKLPESRT